MRKAEPRSCQGPDQIRPCGHGRGLRNPGADEEGSGPVTELSTKFPDKARSVHHRSIPAVGVRSDLLSRSVSCGLANGSYGNKGLSDAAYTPSIAILTSPRLVECRGYCMLPRYGVGGNVVGFAHASLSWGLLTHSKGAVLWVPCGLRNPEARCWASRCERVSCEGQLWPRLAAQRCLAASLIAFRPAALNFRFGFDCGGAAPSAPTLAHLAF